MMYKVYSSNHFLSQEMSKHLSKGFDAQVVPAYSLIPGPTAITYGILRGSGDIIKQSEQKHQDYIYCDHSFFTQSRGSVDSTNPAIYFRLIKNNRYHFTNIKDCPSDRWDRLNITIKDWKKNGTEIHIAPLSKFVAAYMNIDAMGLLNKLVSLLSQTTNKDIVMKPKGSMLLTEQIANAFVLVTWDSNAAVDAIIEGIPVFTSHENPAAKLGLQDITKIESPVYPDREQHLYNLAYQQFTIEEIRNGTARQLIEEYQNGI